MKASNEFSEGPALSPNTAAVFGARVKVQRQNLGLSQEELAWRAGIHRTHLANVERGGKNLTLKNIANLAAALQVTPGFLLNPDTNALDDREIAASPKTILMVEDSDEDAELAMRGLKKARLLNPIKHVRDGSEALHYLRCTGRYGRRERELPHLILLDLVLPDVPGQELLRSLKVDPALKHIPVVVLTASRSERVLAQCREFGAVDYINKPLDFEGLWRIAMSIDFNWSLVAAGSAPEKDNRG